MISFKDMEAQFEKGRTAFLPFALRERLAAAVGRDSTCARAELASVVPMEVHSAPVAVSGRSVVNRAVFLGTGIRAPDLGRRAAVLQRYRPSHERLTAVQARQGHLPFSRGSLAADFGRCRFIEERRLGIEAGFTAIVAFRDRYSASSAFRSGHVTDCNVSRQVLV